MATYIDNIVKFHTFSKAPVRGDLTLGEAVNPSGHTIVTSQVRAQDIPAFLNSFQGDKASAQTWIESNVKTPRHNDIVYYGAEFKAGFTKPSCLKYNAKTSTWEDFDLNAATTLKNADDKDVITIHKNCTVAFVDGGNNANTNSNRNSLFVKRADGSILDHFIAATDKIHEGQPSLGYNALVLWKGAAMDEGEGNDNYIGNTFAGIVHLNKQYATGDDTNNFKVTCYEYTGEKLDKTLTDIDGKIEDIVDASLNGVVASVSADAAAKAAGIDVDSSTPTSPVITLSTGTIGGNSDAKLVTGSTVKAYVDTAETDATNAAVNTISAKSLEATSTGSTQVTVKSAGTVGTGMTLTVETSDIASAQALQTLSDKVDTHITNAAGNLSVSVVDTLPESGETNKIYLVPSADPDTQNVKDEYIWTNGAWELIGSTAVDLTGYATEEYVGTEIGKVTAVTDDHESRIDTIEAAVPAHALKTTSLADEASSADGKVTVKTTGTLETGLSVEVTTEDIASAATVSALSQTVAANASTASTGITEAKEAAQAAQTTANEAKAAATSNSTAIATAQQTAEAAQSAANTADDKAEAADAKAVAAQTDATQALADAATAKTAADDAQADATQALADAAEAKAAADAKVASVTGGGNGITVSGDTAVTIDVGAITEINDNNKESETIVTAKAVTTHISSAITAAGTNYASKDTETVAANAATAAANAATAAATADGKAVAAQTTANEAKTAAATAQSAVDAVEAAYVSTVSVGDVTTSGKANVAFKLVDGRDTTVTNPEKDLWGTSITMDTDGTVTINDSWVTNPTGWQNLCWDVNVKSVKNNLAYTTADATGTPYANIQTEKIKNGEKFFAYTSQLASFNSSLVNLTKGQAMFDSAPLTSFSGDLSNLVNGISMFANSSLTSFCGDLSSLAYAGGMFANCKLDTESLLYIADTINNIDKTVSGNRNINIGIGSSTPTAEENEYLTEIHNKGWSVYVNGSQYTPSAASAVTTTAEDGTLVETPIPFYAKPVQVSEEEAEYINSQGEFFRILGGQFIYVNDPETYGMFTCLDDAARNMGLTKYTKA